MPITGTIPITGTLAPISDAALYPIIDTRHALGGLQSVGTTADRDAIVPRRRAVGMVVYVSSLNKYYNLVGGTANTDWQEFSLGGGAGTTGATGATGNKGETGAIPTDYVESLNSLTGPLQISAGDFVQIEIVGGNTLKITALEATFDSDITASFSTEKSFGKYTYGQRVPAANKTAREVIRDALLDSVNPLATLSSSSFVQFNQTNVSNVLNVTHTIRTIGATGATGVLEWRRNNSGSWTTLNSSLFNSSGTNFSGSHTHTLTDTAYNTQPFNYRYIVFDSRGASAEATFNITPHSYTGAAGTLNQTAVVNRGGVIESNLRRERGNSSTTLSGTVTQRTPLVPPSGWFTEFRQRISGSWSGWSTISSGSFAGSPYTVPSHTHNPTTAATLDEIQYRLQVTDGYDTDGYIATTNSSITFHNLIWYGPTSGPPTTSDHIRSGGLSAFNPGVITNDPFSFNSGTTLTRMVVALPAPSLIDTVVDLNASRATLKEQFLTANSSIGWSGLFTVNDYASNSTGYNVYLYAFSTAYAPPGAQIEVDRT